MTEKYHELDPMSDVISDDYRMLQMIGRFGITLGFGNKTVGETCKEAGVDVTTFLTVVNYVKDAAHAHINEMVEQIDLPCLMRYLKNSHTYFVDFRLPNIRRKLLEAIDCSSSNQIAMLILKFYDEYAAEVGRHMKYEDSHVHPFVENLLNGKVGADSFDMVARQHDDNHASLEKSIAELKSIIIKYYPNDNAAQLMGVNHIAGYPDYKEIADSGGEYCLRHHAGIRTADDDRIWMLSVFLKMSAQNAGRIHGSVGALHKLPVSFLQFFQCRICRKLIKKTL